jgi:Bifunctional DNA primase/polymerase, N-terminal
MELATKTVINAAIDYVMDGYRVIPVFTDGDKAKRPVGYGWQNRAASTVDAVRELFDRDWYGVGIVHGGRSFCFDIDGEAGRVSLAEVEATCGVIPRECVGSTPRGGLHIIVAHPDIKLRNNVGVLTGIDLRGANSQTVSWPTHVTYVKKGDLIDGAYEWRSYVPATQLPTWNGWAKFIETFSETIRPDDDEEFAPNPDALYRQFNEAGSVPAGQRNAWLASVAGKLSRMPFPSEEVFETVLRAIYEWGISDDLRDARGYEHVADLARRSILRCPPVLNRRSGVVLACPYEPWRAAWKGLGK